MQNKKILNIAYLIAFTALAIFFVPGVFAASSYMCPITYSVPTATSGESDAAVSFTDAVMQSCCYPAGDYRGVDCRAEGKYTKSNGTNAPDCRSGTEVNADAKLKGKNLNLKQYDCFNGVGGSVCRDGWCSDTGETCHLKSGATTCTATTTRKVLCAGNCGVCLPGYVYCSATNNPINPPADDTTACVNINYGGGANSESAASSCKSQGLTLLNPCTGQCGCPAGLTYTGRTGTDACVSFAERFIQIFEDGLTYLGGKTWQGKLHSYDYSKTGPDGLKDVYLKSDVAEELNWNNPDLPDIFKKFVTNNYYLCDADHPCPTGYGLVCSDGGLCYNPGKHPGDPCTITSDCDLGLTCDGVDGNVLNSGKCIDPGDIFCSVAKPCVCGVCGTDSYCHTAANGLGVACAGNCNCADGLYCSEGKCRSRAAIGGTEYIGMTAANAFNTALSATNGYAEANKKCNDVGGAFQSSHVCTVDEMLFLINNTPSTLPTSGFGWINGGPAGFVASADDCRAWSNKAVNSLDEVFKVEPNYSSKLYSPNAAYGRFMRFDTKQMALKPCDQNDMPFLCCK